MASECCWTMPLPLLLLLLLPALPQPAAGGDDFCCLPLKWHSRMTHASSKTFTSLLSGKRETKESRIEAEVFVNYRRPKFEVRTRHGSQVFWRGHMWQFAPGARAPRLLSRVRPSFRPSGGLAPLFFRCLAPRFGFRRVAESHYRLVEPAAGVGGFNASTVTDVFVRPLPRPRRRRGVRHNCLLSSFTVAASFLQDVRNFGPAAVSDFSAWRGDNGSRAGWPDRLLTHRTRASLPAVRQLLRSAAGVRNRRRQ